MGRRPQVPLGLSLLFTQPVSTETLNSRGLENVGCCSGLRDAQTNPDPTDVLFGYKENPDVWLLPLDFTVGKNKL